MTKAINYLTWHAGALVLLAGATAMQHALRRRPAALLADSCIAGLPRDQILDLATS
eukprot:COSAG01_NODE_36781_length_512_cov_3.065375_2_plen_56_part_01